MGTIAMPALMTAPTRVDVVAEGQRTELVRLREKHPDYLLNAPDWGLYLQAYEGGPAMTDSKNLFRHTRENEHDFHERVKRLHYQNVCGPLVDFFTNFIFTESIRREGGSNQDWFAGFIEDVDKRGTHITKFMKRFCDDLQIWGTTYTIVDVPEAPLDKDIITKYVEQTEGIRPYWCE